ncbi:carbohydrate porin [Tardiphaga sp. vice352]|uniref:carbohydrate porin n=1 Tax=unclassified Tardiphaga TaxID=2631404 RepID=UPI001162D37D|nr:MULTISPECIES: carbohydrate porin [unclassified Tardiphaga]QDM24146.1 carbohydrate porin [Tardiphaga sp. vice154]QDM34446.1 carbohydrate porin [Tardiphaga sp. vice352]
MRCIAQFLKIWLLGSALCLFTATAFAQLADDEDKPVDEDTGESTVKERTLGILPNPLERWGIKFAATYIGEALANGVGGVQPGATLLNRLNLALDIDFEKAADAKGLTFHGNVFAIYGDQFTNRHLQSFMGASGIEGVTTVRLFEAWFEQKFVNDRLSIRAGQLSADAEFITTKFSDVFTNATFTWPAATAANLPSGGPATPLAALGARFRAKLSDNITGMVAVYDGDPAGPGDGDPQERNRYGLNFRLRDPPLVIGQVEFDWSDAFGKKAPGAFKLGGFRHFGEFDSQRYAFDGRSLADPTSSGMPATLRGNSGVFAVIEQTIATKPTVEDRGIGVFARAVVSPPDRNLIDVYADAGFQANGWFDSRPNDKFGAAIAYAHVSRAVQALDQDYQIFLDPTFARRSSEALVTVAYAYEVRQGWLLQPNAQFIARPGGGAVDPMKSDTPGRHIGNAFILGLRTVVKF